MGEDKGEAKAPAKKTEKDDDGDAGETGRSPPPGARSE